VVGAAVADPAATANAGSSVQTAHIPVQTVQTVVPVAAAAPTQYIATQQPVYVAAQPIQTAHHTVTQLEQQLMRSPQMATMAHLYNIPQTVAAVPVTVYQQQQQQPQQIGQKVVQQVTSRKVVDQVPADKPVQVVVKKEGEVSQQFHSQDDFGNYAYGYANDNSEKQEVGNTRSGQVKGHYTYVDGNGLNRRVDYVADNNGFRAKGDGIKIKREAEPEPEAKRDTKVQMSSYMKSGADQPAEGMRMTSYMSNGVPALQDMLHQQVYVVPSTLRTMQSTLHHQPTDSPLMTYYNRPMVYMAMNGPSSTGTTFTATRNVDDVDSYTMGDRRMGQRQMVNLRTENGLENDRLESMRMGGDMMNMRRNAADHGRQMSLGMEDSDMLYRGQYLLNNNNLYRNQLIRNNVFKTNPTNFMEIQQFEMKPNYNYRFDF